MSKVMVDEALVKLRLDKALTQIIEGKSRSYTLKCIEEGKILVNGKLEKPSYQLKMGDEITYELLEEKALAMDAKDLNLEIVYEDEDVAVVNKPKGMVVHPGAGNTEDTLVHGLLYELDDLATINGVVRPGIVHRIDKDTTGLLMIAKNDMAALGLAEQLKNHSCKRRYQALVYGNFAESKGKINAPIGRDPEDRKKMAVSKTGKPAITHFTVLKRFKEFTLIECELETGRTHQIRVHLSYIGHPIVGDKVYGRRKVIGDQGQFLHAKLIGFEHPRTHKWLEFDSELPEYFKKFLKDIETI
ncbi:MAG: RluA family pseudouridine synthase [Anaeroplasmataceae bacterium]|nr:RluA family pseudouridine synthase [Anaeroplasmataceae bacterium]